MTTGVKEGGEDVGHEKVPQFGIPAIWRGFLSAARMPSRRVRGNIADEVPESCVPFDPLWLFCETIVFSDHLSGGARICFSASVDSQFRFRFLLGAVDQGRCEENGRYVRFVCACVSSS